MVWIDLIYNLALLIGLSVVSGFVETRWKRNTRIGALLQGVVFGSAAVIGMLQPFVFAPGLVFDGRSVMISLGALFFGPWTAGVACLMTVPLRLAQGGPGTLMGVLVILASAGIGVACHSRRPRKLGEGSASALLLFGIVVHLVMLSLTVALPTEMTVPVLKRMGWPVMLTYPLATVLIGRILSDQAARGRLVEELRRANHALWTISQCSRLVVRATHEPALLDGVCRLLVEHGDYRMAWVGFAEADAAKTVRPVAHAGSETGYLENADITWADTERGRGPTGTAIRTGQHVIVRRIPEDPAFAPWRDAAVQRGYASSIALPLKSRARVIGALMLYSTHPDAFDAAETELLTGLAGDLTNGLIALRAQTEQDRAEAALREERHFLAALLDNINEAVVACDAQGQLTRFNRAALRLHGLPPEPIPPDQWARYYDLYQPDGRTLLRRDNIPLFRALQGEHVREFEMMVTPTHGTPRFLVAGGQPLRDPAGRITGAVVTMHDITSRKQAEAALRQSEARYRTLFEYAPDGIVVSTPEGRYLDANAAICRMLGYTRDELLAFHVSDIVSPTEIPHINPALRASESGSDYHREWVLRRKDGSLFPAEVIATRLPDGKPLGMVRDITERRRWQENLIESEKRYRALFENMTSGFVLFEVVQDERGIPVDLVVLAANEGFEKTTGLKAHAVVGNRLTQVLPGIEKDAADWIGTYGRVALTGESRHLEQGSELLGIYYSVTAYQAGPGQCAVTFSDITERRRAEQERQKFALLAESSREFIGMCDLDLKPLYVNPAGVRLVGLPDMDAACRVKVQDYFFPEDRPFITDEFFPRVLREGHGQVEIRLRHFQTGEPIWMSYYLFHMHDADGRVVGWATVSRDITERRRADAALQESEARLRLTLSLSGVGLWDWNLRTDVWYATPTYFEMLGYDPTVEAQNREVWGERTHPDDRAFVVNKMVAVRDGEDTHFDITFRFRHADGSYRWINSAGRAIEFNEAGKPVRMLGLQTDVTERRRMEDALRLNEIRFRTAFDDAPAGMCLTSPEGRFLRVNRAFCLLLDYPESDLLDMGFADITHPDDLAASRRAVECMLAGGVKVSDFEKRYLRRDGQLVWATVRTVLLRKENQQPLYFVTHILDITERKRAEDAVRESEKRFRAFVTASSDVLYRMSPDWGEMRQLDGRGFIVDTLTPSDSWFQEYIDPVDQPHVKAVINEAIRTKTLFELEHRVRRVDGTLGWTFSRAIPVLDAQGEIVEWFGAASNVTERKQSEEDLSQSRAQLRALSGHLETLREEERTRISREIHDELGQMLTGIKMDLRWIEHNLDALGEDRRLNPVLDKLAITGELADATVKTVQRIAAELRPGLLDKLGLGMALQYEASQFEGRTGIACRVLLPKEEPPLSSVATTTCFRVFQEALTNVARHAQATSVEVEFCREAQGVRLEIRDNGQGIADLDLVSCRSLGLVGMQERALLLGGRVAFTPRPGGGTVVSMRLPATSTSDPSV